MKEYILKKIRKVQGLSQTLDNMALLTNQRWVLIDERDNSKVVYIFRSNNDLLISKNGIVEKGKWDSIDTNTLFIETESQSRLYKNGFFDNAILALKIDGKEEFTVFINENMHSGEINKLDDISNFLENKYGGMENLIDSNQITKGINLVNTSYKVTVKRKAILRKNMDFLIEFEDGKKGQISYQKSSGEWFFKKHSFSGLRQLYKSKEACIKGLYYFMCTDEVLKEGYIGERI